MKKTIRLIAVVLAFLICCCCITAYAIDVEDDSAAQDSAKIIAKGETINGIKWVYTVDNTDTENPVITVEVSKDGTPAVLTSNPWNENPNVEKDYSDRNINKVVIGKGVSGISDNVFSNTNGNTEVEFLGSESVWNSFAENSENNGVFDKKPEFEEVAALLGDVNKDGTVTEADADALADFIVGNKTGAQVNSSHKVADVNGDGNIDVCDCVKILSIA